MRRALTAVALPALAFAAAAVPARFIENHIYVPVEVAGVERQWILDTGAGASVIDEGFAGELGLAEAEGEVTAVGAGGAVAASFVTVPGFEVAGMELDGQPMVALGITQLMRRNTGTEPAGILGHDFLSRFVTRIDYAAQTVTFYRPGEFEYEGEGAALPMTFTCNIPAVEMTVEDSCRGMWRLDIGASFSTFHQQSAARYRLAERPGVDRMAGAVGGLQRVRLVRFDHAELAGTRVEGPVIAVPLEEPVGALAVAELDGTLGNSILRNFTVYLDYPGQRVVLEKGGDFGTPFVLDRSGLQVVRSDSGGYQVQYVAADTPAAAAGFLAGDEVIAVGGRSPEEVGGLSALRELMRAEPGTRYRFRVRRAGEDVELELVLAELLD